MEALHYNIENGVAFITLNRPDKYNSFNREMALLLQQKLAESETNPDVRCIYITGMGKAFCAGQDLQEIVNPDSNLDISKVVSDHYNPIVLKIRQIEKPVVAAVNGVAAGAGANLALCCDIVVATASASFIQAFSKIGLIPDTGGTFFLPRLIGLQKASAIIMLGDKISAEEAERLGMIYKVFPDATFEADSKALAEKLATMPTRGLGLTKRALNASVHNDLATQLGVEEALQTAAAHTADYQEGVAAFLEKRSPVFKGV
jgi:2-(1,2-epoxy-1,2-dihydrophenyl)acetyl-CoA isomerase